MNSIVVYGKGKGMNSLSHLLQILKISYVQMDDEDVQIDVVQEADILVLSPGIKLSHRLYRDHAPKILSELSFL